MNNLNINIRKNIFKILFDNEKKSIRVDYLLSSNSINSNFSDDEIRFMHNIVFGVIRHKTKLDYFISKFYNGKYKKLLIKYKTILRIGVYQLFYVNSVPSYAAVNSTVDLCKSIDKKKCNLINAIMRKLSDNIDIKDEDINDLSIKYSQPNWMIDRWAINRSDKELLNLLKHNNTEPKIWFRINANKSSKSEIFEYLNKENIIYEKSKIIDIFFTSTNVQKILKSDLITNDLVSVQNPSNGLVVKLLNPKEKKVIFDGCSAPGGKMRYINEYTNGKSSINSYDIDNKRLEFPSQYLDKFPSQNINLHQADLSISKVESYDYGIIDVPCTGTGVLSKRVDLKWRRNFEHIKEMNQIQKSILENVSKYIKKGGALVYSTCSIEIEENWQIVENFLNSNTNFKLDNADKFISNKFVDNNGCLSIIPGTNGFDGVFAARIIKYD